MGTGPGRPTAAIVLTDDERQTLQRWSRRRTSAQGLALRCRIVLDAEQGLSNAAIADRQGCTPQTVRKWRNRFAVARLDGLHDEPRPGQPRKVSDEDVERVIVATLETKPKDATHWSTRSMAGRCRAVADGGVADLAGVRAQAAPRPRTSRSPRTRSSSTRSAMSWACT